MRKKDDNIHEEVLQISKNQADITKTIFSNMNAHPPNAPTQDIISLEKYREMILNRTLEEYKQSITGDLSPVRKKRYKRRIQNRYARKGVKIE